MSGKYWDVSWNVVTGCTPVSEACAHCWAQPWAERMAAAGIERYQRCGFTPTFHEDELMRPFRWRKPRTIFVALMGDLFHEQITDEQLDRVFAVIAFTPQHRYLLCTKRPERMAAYLEGLLERGGLTEARKALGGGLLDGLELVALLKQGPLANVWCGFTAENQQRLDERAPHALGLAAAGWNTWVSLEPLLGAVNARPYLDYYWIGAPAFGWVVCGGETGADARPMEKAWALDIRDQCHKAEVPFWFKQWGPQGAGRVLGAEEHNGGEEHNERPLTDAEIAELDKKDIPF